MATCLALLGTVAVGLNNGLGQKPALGWNSDYCVNCTKASHFSNLGGFQNEAFIEHIAGFMATSAISGAAGGKTLQQLGYHYVNMDASWNLKTRSASGDLQPNPALWPSGIDATIAKVHSLGLGFGLYGDRGSKDCAGNPGAQGYETQDAKWFAAHKVDFYKEDSCNAPANEGLEQYGKMRDALNATGAEIWFALCGWETIYAMPPRGGNAIGNSARIGPDTGGGWSTVLTNIENALTVSKYAGPSAGGAGGYWNDGSLQLAPGYLNGGQPHTWATLITPERHRTQFNAWCLLAMNILITGNLSALDPYVVETWSNPELLAINQDPLGVAGERLNVTSAPAPPSSPTGVVANTGDHSVGSEEGRHEGGNGGVKMGDPVATLAECGGEPELQTWLLGNPNPSFLRNELFNSASNVCLNVDACRTGVIYDVCSTPRTKSCGPNEQWNTSTDGTAGPIVSWLHGSPCLTASPEGAVSVAPCTGAADQKWEFTNNGTLKDGQGRCLTATGGPAPPPPPGRGPPAAIGRPLANNNFALMFINHATTAQVLTCDAVCLGALGLTAGVSYTVRDAWAHANRAVHITATESVSVTLGANGSSAVLVLLRDPGSKSA